MPLDCVQDHRVFIADRGGKNIIGEINTLNRVKWTRTRDDISQSQIDLFGQACSVQAPFLEQIEPGRHELVIFRNGERVWEGPITRMTYYREGVEIYAHDVMHYAYRTVMHAGYNNAYPNIEFATTRAKNVLVAELARKEALDPPINVVPHIMEHHTASDAKTSRVTKPYEYTVFEHVDEIAARGGIDYTVVGRAIHIWDTDKALAYGPQMTENDILGDLYVSVYGMELGTAAHVFASDGTVGHAGGIDLYYGEWERLATAYEEGKDPTEPAPSVSELNSQAQRNLSARNPTPLQVRIPDNSSLNPNGVLSVSDLVPGVHIPLLATLTARTVSQMQKINNVGFEETANGEKITMTLFPATTPDEEVEP